MSKSKYVVLENGSLNPSLEGGDWEFTGIFDTKAEAKQAIRDEIQWCFNPDHIRDDFSDYCSYYIITKLEDMIHPVPKVTVDVRLKKTDIPVRRDK